MKKRVYLTTVLLLLLLMPGAGLAFVPQAPHLLYLVIEKVRQPVGIEIYQTKTIINHNETEGEVDPGMGSDAKAVTESGIELGPDAETKIKSDIVSENVIEEKLIYVFPHKLKSQIISETQTGFSVESDFAFIKVMESQFVTSEKSAMDFYTDILLYRDHESLLQQLNLAGVDTNKVSFQRYDETICYLIGDTYSGLWIDKETLFPVRYVLQKNNWNIEFLYGNWSRRSRTWYPMNISIHLDNQLFATINAQNFELKSQPSLDMFDISQIKQIYPGEQRQHSDTKSSQVDELDKSIENFKKLYE